jgi:hypothetical protein
VVKRVGSSYYLIGFLAVGLAAVIGVGVLCVVCAIRSMRKRAMATGKGDQESEIYGQNSNWLKFKFASMTYYGL